MAVGGGHHRVQALGRGVARQIAGRGIHPHPLPPQGPCGQHAAVGQRAAADREIDALVHEVDHAVAEDHFQRQFGMRGGKFHQHRRHQLPAQQDGRRHTQPAARRSPAGLDDGIGGVQLCQCAPAAFVIGLAVFGQALAARAALEQARPQSLFQPGHALGHGPNGCAATAARPARNCRPPPRRRKSRCLPDVRSLENLSIRCVDWNDPLKIEMRQ